MSWRIAADNLTIEALPKTRNAGRRTHHDPNHYKLATVDRVIDGDSAWLFIDLDFDGITAHRNCRLIGIDAPDKQPAKQASRDWLAARLAPGAHVNVFIPGIDKYGRPLVGVYVDEYGPSLNEASIAAGMAVPYWGGPRGGDEDGTKD